MNFKELFMLSALLIVSIQNVACSVATVGSSQVSSQSIHQMLSSTYSEESNSTTHWAQFRVGGFTGTTVALEAPAKISANGMTLAQQSFFGTYYSAVASGAPSRVSYDWTGQDGRHFVNETKLVSVSMATPSTTLNRGQNYQVQLLGSPLQSDETIDAQINQKATGQDGYSQTLISYGKVDPKTLLITFTAAEMLKLQEGAATLNVSRSNSKSIQQDSGHGGTISAIYKLRPVNLMIINSNPNQLSLAQK